MNSLHARLTLLLMVAVTAVAVLAAFVTYSIVDPPRRQTFDLAFAQEARLVSALLAGSAEKAASFGLKTGPAPRADEIRHQQTDGVNGALAGFGEGLEVIVATVDTSAYLAIPLQHDIWAYVPFPALPESAIRPLAAYLMIVVLGSVAIAILAANKIVSPLRMLETAIASVGPDGEMLRIDERGPVEVRATARALNRLSSRLKVAMESRMRLVAAAGHDLRTPMTRMRLRAEFLPLEEQETWLKDLEELDRIADSAIRLVREEVADQPAEDGVALAPLLAEIGAELRELGLGVDWEVSPGILVAGRPLALKRALRNLVDNAATHGGGANVRMRTEGNSAVIEIDDEGPGIPEALLARVFEPFFRVDAGRRKSRPGAGLGLAIAKEILDQAGGTIRVENRPQGGLRQTVTLPLAKPG
ncbi:two-component sensor histidine kinase [Aureimonas sp. SA4125]|uniref:ATP-binding protein n=1 Tax=Aureimonas sp. SA4125 TaxID=2826993 RepID=UPI001CC7C774|nr:ATP-binding protein [Aureimonas sp. SA4125]BDA85667.1 two-component sensor histidine kinase [Aureimonas sp. SA4125]